MKTSKTQLDSLQETLIAKKEAFLKAKREFEKYSKEYNEERGTKNTTLVEEIVALRKKGMTMPEIVQQGYNKNYVSKIFMWLEKGKRFENTVVIGWIPKKVKK